MKKVFVGGSRRISRLNEQLRKRIDQIIKSDLQILVGDANGADKAIQGYLDERGYQNVLVFCSGGDCRNNVGMWEVKSVRPPHARRNFDYFTAKDAAMAQQADVGFMIWDGQSSGSVVNAARLIAAGKPVVVYIAPEKEFRTVKSQIDFEALLSPCPPEIRERIDRYVADHAYAQPAMF
jgi:hypothetical protein